MGNGAAMRIAPVAVAFATDPNLLMNAEASARITHTHELGVQGAMLQAKAIAGRTWLDYQQWRSNGVSDGNPKGGLER